MGGPKIAQANIELMQAAHGLGMEVIAVDHPQAADQGFDPGKQHNARNNLWVESIASYLTKGQKVILFAGPGHFGPIQNLLAKKDITFEGIDFITKDEFRVASDVTEFKHLADKRQRLAFVLLSLGLAKKFPVIIEGQEHSWYLVLPQDAPKKVDNFTRPERNFQTFEPYSIPRPFVLPKPIDHAMLSSSGKNLTKLIDRKSVV